MEVLHVTVERRHLGR